MIRSISTEYVLITQIAVVPGIFHEMGVFFWPRKFFGRGCTKFFDEIIRFCTTRWGTSIVLHEEVLKALRWGTSIVLKKNSPWSTKFLCFADNVCQPMLAAQLCTTGSARGCFPSFQFASVISGSTIVPSGLAKVDKANACVSLYAVTRWIRTSDTFFSPCEITLFRCVISSWHCWSLTSPSIGLPTPANSSLVCAMASFTSGSSWGGRLL